MSRNLEVCAFSIKDLIKVSSVKPARIEFCENKSIGGITPDLKLIESAVSSGIPIFPIIRPRGGSFIYSKKEIDQNQIEKFCDHIVSKIDKGGTVWVHDYQLLLLPKMIKQKKKEYPGVRGSLLVLVMAAPFSMQVFAMETVLSVTTVQIVDAAPRVNQSSYKRIG